MKYIYQDSLGRWFKRFYCDVCHMEVISYQWLPDADDWYRGKYVCFDCLEQGKEKPK